MPKHLDRSGQSFNNWSIIEKSNEVSKNGSIVYKCRCICGYEVKTSISSIVNGKSKRCKNCAVIKHPYLDKPKIDLRNQKINNLMPLEPVKGDSGWWWKCKCDCGVIKNIRAYDIVSGKSKSCGCGVRVSGHNNKRWKGYQEISGNFFANIQRGAEYRKLEFSITLEYIWNLYLKQNRKCALSDINIDFSTSGKSNEWSGTASLDRIDSSKGYIEGNVQWVHKTINQMKMDLAEKDFLYFCEKVYLNKTKNEHN